MKPSNLIIVFALVVSLALLPLYGCSHEGDLKPAAQNVSGSFVLRSERIVSHERPADIDATYPVIEGKEAFNNKSKAVVDDELSTFRAECLDTEKAKKQASPEQNPETSCELLISYRTGMISEKQASIVFNIYRFTGGAHGMTILKSLNMDLSTGSEMKLGDLFPSNPIYPANVSERSILDLTRQIKERTEDVNGTHIDNDWIRQGAGANETNFKNFIFDRKDLTIFFEQYQVAPGYIGQLEVTMPMPRAVQPLEG